MQVKPGEDLLLAVDVQPDFMPGGALAVPDGEAVVGVINCLLDTVFTHAVATQDWHPPGHFSFASSHPGKKPFETIAAPWGEQTLWPDHCVQGTPGAALHPALAQGKIELIVRKGFRPMLDSYSAFRENDRRTSLCLAEWVRARGFRRLFLAGLATDYCVAWSAEDALAADFQVVVVEDACRGIGLKLAGGGTTLDQTRARLVALGAGFIGSAELQRG